MKSYNIAVIGGDGTGPEVVREAVKVLDAAAKKFQLKLNYTNYDLGGARYLKTGETISIQPLLPILQVGDTSRLRVRAEIDETEVGQLKLGQRAWVTAPAYPNKRFTGVISRIGQRMGRKTVRSDEPTEKNDTAVLDVLIELDDPGVRLPVGLRMDVFLEAAAVAQH